jgi:hypothetical protein
MYDRMKKYFLLSLFFMPLSLNGQNNFMALSFGGNFPLQDFAKYTLLTSHGFALTGFTGDYSGAFFMKKNLGIGGNIRYASNSVDDQSIMNLITEEFPMEFPLNNDPSYLTGFWKYISLLAGPEYTFASDRMNFDLYAQMGINFVFPPEMNIHAENQDDYYDRRLDLRTVNLGMETGFAIRYHLSLYSSLRIHLSWFYSSCSGEIIKEMEIAGNKTSEKTRYTCTINTLNSGIGIVYRL